MIFKEIGLKGAWLIELEKLQDDRGFFARAYCADEFREHGIDHPIVQINVSHSKKKHTLRGMHYQVEPYRESKLMRCTKGAIYDVIIDIRKNSPTYKQWTGVELTEYNHRMLFVPEGCAHGFLTLEDNSEVIYPVSEFYTPGAESGIKYDDPAFNIDWPVPVEIVSDKDKSWPLFDG